ncbi:MAG: hypothetical protein FWB93_03900 [Oscillospiraceae bacterium]|nr:hypothetical protein [Oscillospiraceae bacterium]
MLLTQQNSPLWSVGTPVFITTESGQMVYKNRIAEIAFPKPRIGGNIVPFITFPKNLLCPYETQHDIHKPLITQFQFSAIPMNAVLTTYVQANEVYCVWVFIDALHLFEAGTEAKFRDLCACLTSLAKKHFSVADVNSVPKKISKRTTKDFIGLLLTKKIVELTATIGNEEKDCKNIKKILNSTEPFAEVFKKSGFDFKIRLNIDDGNGVHFNEYSTLEIFIIKLAEVFFETKYKQVAVDVSIAKDVLHFVYSDGKAPFDFDDLVQFTPIDKKDIGIIFPEYYLEIFLLKDICRQHKWNIDFYLTKEDKVVIHFAAKGAEDRRHRARLHVFSNRYN